jgi:molecular chaperone GrpE
VEVIEAAPVNHEEYERLLAERDEFLNALQLVKADFDNYRKRVERDRAAERQAAGRDILVEILPVMDNLDRALAALGDADNGVRAGIEMVRGQLAGTLAARGITEIEAHERMEFDPNVHEAVVQSHSPGFPEGTLIAVVEKGYRHNDTVIRPAKVVVAAAAADG